MNQLEKGLLHWYFPVTMMAFMLTIFLLGGHLSELLSYQVSAIQNGDYWRLFTAHIVHLNDFHLYLNIAGLSLIWWLVGERFKPIEWLGLTVFLALMVSLGLMIFNPELSSYVGLSGVLHGLLIAGVLMKFDSYQEMTLIVLIAIKLLYEQTYGPFVGSERLINGHVIVDAHLYGALAAMGYMLLRRALMQRGLVV